MAAISATSRNQGSGGGIVQALQSQWFWAQNHWRQQLVAIHTSSALAANQTKYDLGQWVETNHSRASCRRWAGVRKCCLHQWR
jgi:hypothetical protein